MTAGARLAGVAAGVLAWLWAAALPVRRRVAVEALLATGMARDRRDAARQARAVARHLALLALELPALWGATDAALRRRTSVRGVEPLVARARAGEGVVVVTAHLGNWEVLGAVARLEGVPASLVIRPPRGVLARALVAAVRRRLGADALVERGSVAAARRALAAGRAVGFAIDQRPPSRHHVPGHFLGRPAGISTVPASLALSMGAPVFTALTWRRPDGVHEVDVEGPFEPPREGDARTRIAALTLALHARVEAAVRAHPEQWLWMHRRWRPVGARPGRRGSALQGGGGPAR